MRGRRPGGVPCGDLRDRRGAAGADRDPCSPRAIVPGPSWRRPAALLLDEPRVREDLSGRVVSSVPAGVRLGAGGMGEVYRARDTRLEPRRRDQGPPGAFAADADRLARFEREAQVLASLNHPNIGAIYGLEESGGTSRAGAGARRGPDARRPHRARSRFRSTRRCRSRDRSPRRSRRRTSTASSIAT